MKTDLYYSREKNMVDTMNTEKQRIEDIVTSWMATAVGVSDFRVYVTCLKHNEYRAIITYREYENEPETIVVVVRPCRVSHSWELECLIGEEGAEELVDELWYGH